MEQKLNCCFMYLSTLHRYRLAFHVVQTAGNYLTRSGFPSSLVYFGLELYSEIEVTIRGIKSSWSKICVIATKSKTEVASVVLF